MRHRNAGFKLGRNTSHRRALLRNLVTSVIVEDRVETTLTKAKAVRPLVEKMITLGKNNPTAARRNPAIDQQAQFTHDVDPLLVVPQNPGTGSQFGAPKKKPRELISGLRCGLH